MKKKTASILAGLATFIITAIVVGFLAFVTSSFRILVIIIEGVFAAEETDVVVGNMRTTWKKIFKKLTDRSPGKYKI